jgi:hypothetical protein
VFGGDDTFQETLVATCGVEPFRLRSSRAQLRSFEGSMIFGSSEGSDALGTLILTLNDPFSEGSVAGIALGTKIALHAILRPLPACDSDRE